METTDQITEAVFLWQGCYYYGIGQAKKRSHSTDLLIPNGPDLMGGMLE
jgi:hypothetical protein